MLGTTGTNLTRPFTDVLTGSGTLHVFAKFMNDYSGEEFILSFKIKLQSDALYRRRNSSFPLRGSSQRTATPQPSASNNQSFASK
jgi:hypothetical protein